MKRIVVVLISLAFSIISSFARADSMRCGDNLVQTGDDKAKVLVRCGQPLTKEVVEVKGTQNTSTQGQIVGLGAGISKYSETTLANTSSVPIERWIYNLGEGQFMRILTFEGNKIIKIELGDKP